MWYAETVSLLIELVGRVLFIGLEMYITSYMIDQIFKAYSIKYLKNS